MKISHLFENVKPQYLYHALTPEFAVTQLKENRIHATTPQRFWSDGKYRLDKDPDYKTSGWMFGVSLTRYRQFAARWKDVIYVIDYSKLKSDYKIIPFCWGGTIAGRKAQGKREFEEFVITEKFYQTSNDKFSNKKGNKKFDSFTEMYKARPHGYINNLDKYLVSIHFSKRSIDLIQGGWNAEFVEAIRNHPKFVDEPIPHDK